MYRGLSAASSMFFRSVCTSQKDQHGPLLRPQARHHTTDLPLHSCWQTGPELESQGTPLQPGKCHGISFPNQQVPYRQCSPGTCTSHHSQHGGYKNRREQRPNKEGHGSIPTAHLLGHHMAVALHPPRNSYTDTKINNCGGLHILQCSGFTPCSGLGIILGGAQGIICSSPTCWTITPIPQKQTFKLQDDINLCLFLFQGHSRQCSELSPGLLQLPQIINCRGAGMIAQWEECLSCIWPT